MCLQVLIQRDLIPIEHPYIIEQSNVEMLGLIAYGKTP
jgi:hypothetical protein